MQRDCRVFGSVWFNPQSFNEQVTKFKSDHSIGCQTVGGNEWNNFLEMDLVAQDYVLACKNRSHDSVKFIFKHFMDTPSSEDIEKGKLF